LIERPPSVRFARPGDEIALYEMLIETGEAFTLAKYIPYDRIVLMEIAEAAVAGKDGWIVGFAEDDSGPVGTIGFIRDRWWWTRDCYCHLQRWLFVKRRAQGKGYAADLFRFGKWCHQHMAHDIAAAGDPRPFLTAADYVSLDRLAARERIWSRWGRKVGSIYLAGLPE
jgi:GNAT superfamily N-acetyltransferase